MSESVVLPEQAMPATAAIIGQTVMVGFFNSHNRNSPEAFPGIVSEVNPDGTIYAHVFARSPTPIMSVCVLFASRDDAKRGDPYVRGMPFGYLRAWIR